MKSGISGLLMLPRGRNSIVRDIGGAFIWPTQKGATKQKIWLVRNTNIEHAYALMDECMAHCIFVAVEDPNFFGKILGRTVSVYDNTDRSFSLSLVCDSAFQALYEQHYIPVLKVLGNGGLINREDCFLKMRSEA